MKSSAPVPHWDPSLRWGDEWGRSNAPAPPHSAAEVAVVLLEAHPGAQLVEPMVEPLPLRQPVMALHALDAGETHAQLPRFDAVEPAGAGALIDALLDPRLALAQRGRIGGGGEAGERHGGGGDRKDGLLYRLSPSLTPWIGAERRDAVPASQAFLRRAANLSRIVATAGSVLPSHAGLDPASTFLFATVEEGGPRLKAGVTIVVRAARRRGAGGR